MLLTAEVLLACYKLGSDSVFLTEFNLLESSDEVPAKWVRVIS